MTCHPVCVRFLAFLHRSVVPAPPPAHLNIHQVLWQYPSLLVYYNLSGFRPLTRFASKIVSVFVLGIGRMSSDANKLAIATSSPVSRTNSTAFETRFWNQRSTVICHSDRIYLWINQLGSNHPAFCTRLLPEVRHTKAIAQSIGCIQCWVEAFSEPTFGLCKICREAGVANTLSNLPVGASMVDTTASCTPFMFVRYRKQLPRNFFTFSTEACRSRCVHVNVYTILAWLLILPASLFHIWIPVSILQFSLLCLPWLFEILRNVCSPNFQDIEGTSRRGGLLKCIHHIEDFSWHFLGLVLAIE